VYRHFFLPILLLSFLLVIGVGCGGGGNNNGGGGGGVPGINVVVTSPVGAAAADANQALSITVQVQNDSGNAGVTWSVAPTHKGDPAGTLNDATATSVTYNPPVNLGAPEQVTVLATSVADATRSAAIPVSLYPAPTITTQSSDLDVGFVNTDYTCILRPIDGNNLVKPIPCAVNVSGGMGPYTWSLGNTVLPDGLSLAPSQGGLIPLNATEIVGQPTQIGPNPIVGVHTFSLTATDSLGVAANASLSISVAPNQLKVAAPALLSIVAGKPYAPVALQASGGVPPYTWRIAPGSAGLDGTGMTLSPSGVISGTPTGATATFAVQVLDSQTPVPAQAIYPAPSQSNPKIIALSVDGLDAGCRTEGPKLQTGVPHAFLFSGFDKDGPVTISGSFAADSNGNLTGEEDVIRSGGGQMAVALTPGSSIGFGADGRGCLTLNTVSSNAQFRVAPTTIATGNGGAVFTEGRILEFDDVDGTGTRGTGFFRIQDIDAFSTDAIAGPYAFRLSGWNATGGHFAMAGTATAATGLLTAVSADVNNAGALSGALVGGSGTIGSVDAHGRGTTTIGIGSGTYDLILYVLDANHLIFNSTGPATSGHPLITGEATTSAGPFSPATLNDSHIYRLGGSLPGSPDVGIGVLHFDGAGSVSGTAFERTGGTASATTLSGQVAVDSTTGRFTFSGTSVPSVGYAIPAASGTTAYLVGTGPSAASGVMEFQTDSYPPGYQFSPIKGVYGFSTYEILDRQTTSFEGLETANLDGSLQNSSVDSSGPSPYGIIPVQTYNNLFQYTWNAEGLGAYGGNTYMVTNGASVFYIDISPLNGHPAVVVGQRQQ
jgi:hypothetical protein